LHAYSHYFSPYKYVEITSYNKPTLSYIQEYAYGPIIGLFLNQ